MFKNNFVVAVKASGKVLREFDDTVYIPFGTEYSILLKNLSRRKVKAHIKIDGQDALDGMSLIIDANDSIDLKRFIKNRNMDAGNAFKFIEKTEKIEKHRGNRAEDGLITVEYEFEVDWQNRIQGSLVSKPRGYDGTYYGYNGIPDGTTWSYSSSFEDSVHDGQASLGDSPRSLQAMYTAQVNAAPLTAKSTAGITAPGSIQEQKFSLASHFFGDGTKHSMTLQLKGLVEGQQEVKKPVTVTRLKRCGMCGTNVRQVAKFCHECGSSVEIV